MTCFLSKGHDAVLRGTTPCVLCPGIPAHIAHCNQRTHQLASLSMSTLHNAVPTPPQGTPCAQLHSPPGATHVLMGHVQGPSSTTEFGSHAQQAHPAKPEPQTSPSPRLSPDPGPRELIDPTDPITPKDPTSPALQGSQPHQQAAAAGQAVHPPGQHTGPAASRGSPGSLQAVQVQLLCSGCAVLLVAWGQAAVLPVPSDVLAWTMMCHCV